MDPLSQPFEGSNFQSHPEFPGRLLVVGESAYLTSEDLLSEFTKVLLSGVATGGRTSGGRINYFRKLFFVLTGKRSRAVDDAKWKSVWNSLAFYHFVQTPLTGARQRPTVDDWQKSKAAFARILARLNPALVLMTGKQLNACVRSIDGVIPHDEKSLRLPTVGQEFALATCICHPSSSWFKSNEARGEFERLIATKS